MLDRRPDVRSWGDPNARGDDGAEEGTAAFHVLSKSNADDEVTAPPPI